MGYFKLFTLGSADSFGAFAHAKGVILQSFVMQFITSIL